VHEVQPTSDLHVVSVCTSVAVANWHLSTATIQSSSWLHAFICALALQYARFQWAFVTCEFVPFVTGTMRRAALRLVPFVQGSRNAASKQAVPLLNQLQARGFADDANLKKTTLYDFHVSHGGAACHPIMPPPHQPQAPQPHIYLRRCRQDGAFRGLGHAHPVQGLHHGLHHLVPAACLPV
jgi:hypothetical protein